MQVRLHLGNVHQKQRSVITNPVDRLLQIRLSMLLQGDTASKFPAEHLSLLLEWFTPFCIAIIPVLYSIFGQQLLFKGKHGRVVPIHGHVCRKLKGEVKRFKIAIMFSVRRRRFRKKGMDLWKQNHLCYVWYCLANECSYRCFTKTIIPPALKASESIAHSAFMGFWVRVHWGSRNNC